MIISLKRPYISLIIGSRASECKNSPWEVWPAEVLPVINFGLILKKKNGHHSQIFQNHLDALKLEILQLASANLNKRYMAREVSLIVNWPSFENKMAAISYALCQMN